MIRWASSPKLPSSETEQQPREKRGRLPEYQSFIGCFKFLLFFFSVYNAMRQTPLLDIVLYPHLSWNQIFNFIHLPLFTYLIYYYNCFPIVPTPCVLTMTCGCIFFVGLSALPWLLVWSVCCVAQSLMSTSQILVEFPEAWGCSINSWGPKCGLELWMSYFLVVQKSDNWRIEFGVWFDGTLWRHYSTFSL